MIKINNVYKSYSEINVLENINIEIGSREIIGIVGPNGSGKTTILNLIMSHLDFNGEILIEGVPNDEYLKNNRDDILFLPDQVFTYQFLTGSEFLKFIFDLKKIQFKEVEKNVKLLFKLFNLEDRSDSLIKDYSHGMKQKIALMSVLLQSPKILLLDEPATGLDIMSLITLKKFLTALSKKGTTIVFTTHVLDLIDNLCDSIIVINNKQANKIVNTNKMSRKEIESNFLGIVGGEIDRKIEEIEFS
jgi:ABC-2 type transport system ATP-binding protein